MSEQNDLSVFNLSKRQRHTARVVAVQKYKRQLLKQGLCSCEVCGWKAPEYLQTLFGRKRFVVNLHHILPVASGGTEDPENLILLCPNHHAIADLLAGRFNKGRGSKINSFITDRRELVEMLQLIDSNPEEWEHQMEERFSRIQGEMVNLLEKYFD